MPRVADVVPFAPRKPAIEEETGDLHVCTPVLCLACGHKWQGVAPVGTTGFVCPECTTDRGVSVAHCLPEDGCVWTHRCGCHAFAFSSQYKSWMCLSCGELVTF